jgi:hypothetical protein
VVAINPARSHARYDPAMRPALLLVVVPALALSTGCLLGGGDDYPEDTSRVIIAAGDECPGELVAEEVSIVDGTDLVVTARYGGCSATRVWACWDGTFVATDPPFAYVAIHHEPAGDCDALLQSEARISLAPMSSGPAGSVVQLLILPGVSLDNPLVWTHP